MDSFWVLVEVESAESLVSFEMRVDDAEFAAIQRVAEMVADYGDRRVPTPTVHISRAAP